MGFKDELLSFSQVVIEKQSSSEKELVSDEDVVRALNILRYIDYKKVPDAFLGCASLNLLNTYVKQKDSQLGYRFRVYLSELLKGIEDINQPKSIKILYQQGEKNTNIMFVFWDFQFSFHNEKRNEVIDKLKTTRDIPWDGIRKQHCAVSIFKFATNNSWITNKTLDGNDLRKFIDEEVNCFRRGGYKFLNGDLIKTNGIIKGNTEHDKYLKNYARYLLTSCKDRPVILIGTFKKVWKKHVTFTTIRPYIQGVKTLTICDHINLYRPAVEKALNVSELVKDKKYYIIGFCEEYRNADRMGVNLADIGFCPIIAVDDFQELPKDIFFKCHRFSVEEFISKKQRHLKF